MTSKLPVLRVAAVGDSLTKGYLSMLNNHPYTKVLEANGILVTNFGSNGALTQDLFRFMKRVVKHKGLWDTSSEDEAEVNTAAAPEKEKTLYKYVVLLGGTNDLGHGLEPATVVENLTRLADMAHEAGVFPFLVTVPPLGSRLCDASDAAKRTEVNRDIKQLCSLRGFGLVDLFAAVVQPGKDSMRDELTIDQLHFNPLGYNLMGELVFDAIAKHYEKNEDPAHHPAAEAMPTRHEERERLPGKSHC